MELLDGVPLGRADAVITERGLDRIELARLMARHLSPGLIPDAQAFADMFRIVSAYGVAVPPEIAAVFRTLATLQGTLARRSSATTSWSSVPSWLSACCSSGRAGREARRTAPDGIVPSPGMARPVSGLTYHGPFR